MVKTEKKSLKVGKYVDNEHADTLIRNYKHERWVHNSERIGKEDSLSCWYTVDELEEFIRTSKAHGADGIKFYFGAYPKSYDPRPEYAGRQTVLLVATKSKTTETGVENKNIYISKGEKNQILAYNVGVLCPPWCQKVSPGTTHEAGIGITIVDRGEKGLTIV
jgi:hypothetical protein